MTVDAKHADDARRLAMGALRDVWDPELGLDVVSLGLVYDIRIERSAINIDMTLTTPGCPVSESLPAEAEAALRRALPGFDVTVRVVWDPPWSPERMSNDALAALGFPRQ
jgi:metal-sulfur cluster biosynthetic enzyme